MYWDAICVVTRKRLSGDKGKSVEITLSICIGILRIGLWLNNDFIVNGYDNGDAVWYIDIALFTIDSETCVGIESYTIDGMEGVQ